MTSTPTIHCPYCGAANDYYAQACVHCSKDISGVPRPVLTTPAASTPPVAPSAEDTVKLSTVILIIVGVVLVATVIGPIVCGVGAYFSYKSPNKSWPF